MGKAAEKPWGFPVEHHTLFSLPVIGRWKEMTSIFRISDIQGDILFDQFLKDTFL